MTSCRLSGFFQVYTVLHMNGVQGDCWVFISNCTIYLHMTNAMDFLFFQHNLLKRDFLLVTSYCEILCICEAHQHTWLLTARVFASVEVEPSTTNNPPRVNGQTDGNPHELYHPKNQQSFKRISENNGLP